MNERYLLLLGLAVLGTIVFLGILLGLGVDNLFSGDAAIYLCTYDPEYAEVACERLR